MLHRDLCWSDFNSAASQLESDNNCFSRGERRRAEKTTIPPISLHPTRCPLAVASIGGVEGMPVNKSVLHPSIPSPAIMTYCGPVLTQSPPVMQWQVWEGHVIFALEEVQVSTRRCDAAVKWSGGCSWGRKCCWEKLYASALFLTNGVYCCSQMF